jgi:anti-sigma regulatory factor (Ser/Thr protein kinase)
VSRSVSLPFDVKSPSLARRHVEQFVADQGLDGATATISIIASELVTNAVIHGAEPVELTLRSDKGDVTIEVADGDERIDNIRPRAGHQSGGRGLHIVASLADRWGIRASHTGKTVWATVSTTHA